MGADLRTTEVLKDLMEFLHASEEHYRRAAERTESGDLKRILMVFAAQRGRLARALHAQIKWFGESNPPDTGSLIGLLHRTLSALSVAITSDHDRPPSIHELLRRQLEENRIRSARLRAFD